MHGGSRIGAGRPIGSKSEKALEQEILRQYIFDTVKRNKKKIVEALLSKAVNGELPAIKELLERSLGKSEQGLEVQFYSNESVLTQEEKIKLDLFVSGLPINEKIQEALNNEEPKLVS